MADYLLDLADYLTYALLRLSKDQLGLAVDFFIYDSMKILLLLFLMVFAIGFLRTYIPQEKMREFLSKKSLLTYLFAAVFGAVTPFCSCSSIPIFIGFIRTGVPLGAALTFLVASPLIDLYLVAVIIAEFGTELGPKITAAYFLFGMALSIGAGLVLNRMDLEKHLEEDIRNERANGSCMKETWGIKTLRERLIFGLEEAVLITKKLWRWVLVGVGIGALIHGFIPQELIQGVLSTAGMLSVPLAVLIGVPIYANCAAVVPIAAALFAKGVPLGTALALVMAASALSLPEAIMLRRVMKLPLIIAFFGIVAAGIIILGYLFDFLIPLL